MVKMVISLRGSRLENFQAGQVADASSAFEVGPQGARTGMNDAHREVIRQLAGEIIARKGGRIAAKGGDFLVKTAGLAWPRRATTSARAVPSVRVRSASRAAICCCISATRSRVCASMLAISCSVCAPIVATRAAVSACTSRRRCSIRVRSRSSAAALRRVSSQTLAVFSFSTATKDSLIGARRVSGIIMCRINADRMLRFFCLPIRMNSVLKLS